MDVQQEIAKHVEKPPPAMQEQVLRFVASLTTTPRGEKGTVLRQFSGTLDSLSARQMIEAIEKECERVDTTPASSYVR